MTIIQLLYLMIPAYVANMIPVFVRKMKWKPPMDFGLTLGGKRLFGKNKTWTGFIAGVVGAVVAGFIMSRTYWVFEFSAVQWSVLAGAGALLGDAVESFFKRRVGITPGKPWIPFDQIDYSVGALALGSMVFFPGWLNALWIVLISLVGHIAVNHCSYYLGIRDVKW